MCGVDAGKELKAVSFLLLGFLQRVTSQVLCRESGVRAGVGVCGGRGEMGTPGREGRGEGGF